MQVGLIVFFQCIQNAKNLLDDCLSLVIVQNKL